LRAYYPQTYQTIQNNEAVAQQQQHAASQAPQPAASGSPSSSSTEQSSMVPLTLNDIKALTAAGVKPDVIKKEIDMSQSKFTSQDVAAAQQANPPIDASVIEDMKSHSS
jgi:hypothetical protein